MASKVGGFGVGFFFFFFSVWLLLLLGWHHVLEYSTSLFIVFKRASIRCHGLTPKKMGNDWLTQSYKSLIE